MKSIKSSTIILPALLLCLGLFHSAAALGQAPWKGTCNITFAGTSTLHDWSGKVSAEPFVVAISGADDPGNAGIVTVVKVKAANMDTDKKKRDNNMHESLDVTSHPLISVTLPQGTTTALTKPVISNGIPRPTVIPFTINLLGKDQQLVGTVSNWKYADGVAKFRVSFSVSLKASGIKVPAVLGIIRVGDEIKVTADLTLVSPEAANRNASVTRS